MRSGVLCLASLALTMTVVGNAWHQRQQFYPSVVYITKSNPSMAVIYLQSLIVVVLLGKVMRKIFFGQLRAAEFEHLMERSWYAVTETCLAFTVFKDDFSPKFVGLFVLLLFLKSFHWLAEERVDFMERSPVITFLFHLRVFSLSVFLAALDILFIQHACTSTITKGASVQLVFGFEYAILLTIVLNTLVKYALHSLDLHSETPWENKAAFMLYTELFIGFIKVLLYVVFFMIMVRIFTLPLFAVRPMYLTMRAFKKAFNDVVMSRQAIHIMNTMFPDATADELENTVCIICREDMAAPSAKKLPCNHMFHRNCLRSWFQRQQTCPTCRLDILRSTPAANSAAGGAAAGGAGGGLDGAGGGPVNFQQQVAALRQQLEALQHGRNQQQQQVHLHHQHNMPNLLNLLGLPPQPPIQVPQQGAAVAAAAAPPAAGAAAATAAPTTSSTAPTTATTAASAGATGVPTSPPPTLSGRPPLLLPPFPPFLAFNVPPPMPPPNFQGLSEAELLEMEGVEREHVEARIRCLRNVQVLLDAAVLEMQQYSAVVARCTAQQTVSARSSAASATSTTSTTAASTSSTAASMTSQPTSSTSSVKTEVPSSTAEVATASSSVSAFQNTGARPKVSASTASHPMNPAGSTTTDTSPAAAKNNGTSDTTSATKVKPTPEKENPFVSLVSSEEQEEMRRRRLAVFEQHKKRLMK